ncbi:hypothetical protein D9619_003550 [Psilocybe cf. subviscida]|uniref:Uncharacterized protein n=1 Tax=Psilocybe cf. subviscida TaxID=2480587 RepID=A0A8H5AY29_9AGAR|nr:hypothetical protein D9619_003550 [Psilocybe cf. subviscida]
MDARRISPVRGQLESQDARTPQGTRYIQLTDTPDELKVLLPPGTATMYEQLLKLENYELAKKTTVSWERIMEIRHLKDRMIRKCQKLAKTSMPVAKTSTRADTFSFQTFVAPTDFRCKEMEKWFREQQKRGPAPRTPKAIAGYEVVPAGPSKTRTTPNKVMQRSITNPEPSPRRKEIEAKPLPTIPGTRLLQTERTASLPAAPRDLFSPPPLPVLLLSQRESYNLPPTFGSAGSLLNNNDETALSPSPEPIPPPEPVAASPPPAEPLAASPPNTLRPSLSRRSSLGLRRNSVDVKTVSWADNNVDLDAQFSKYATAAREAQASGKFEEVRQLYLDQIAGLENLHLQVKEGLEHLRSETDHLQRIDETIRKQRSALDATFQDFEQKQTLFREKVQEALTEATDALSRQGLKRDLEPIHEHEHDQSAS